ncbi:MAG: alpha/beta hydrolase [Anaerolineales bacterium]|nr:alpha/beta hydrolase [Anaerolineales bacterium]
MSAIPYLELNSNPGMSLHFAHANGYPPRAYLPFLESLAKDFHVTAMEMRPLWPEREPREVQDWGDFVGDLLTFVETVAVRAGNPVVGVGHSLGGTVTLMAALQRPALFRALVLIDPPFFPPRASLVWQVMFRVGLAGRMHPLVKGALKRRNQFESREAMFAHYRKKKVFAKMDDRALGAYVDALAVPAGKGVTLRFSPAWEARVYETGLLRDWKTWRELRGLPLPILLLRPDHTPTTPDKTVELLRQRAPQTIHRYISDTTHLAPMERPETVAEMVRAFV